MVTCFMLVGGGEEAFQVFVEMIVWFQRERRRGLEKGREGVVGNYYYYKRGKLPRALLGLSLSHTH